MSTRELILMHGLVPAGRLVHAPTASLRNSACWMPATPSRSPTCPAVPTCFMWAVASAKRIDVLLEVFAGVRSQIPDLKLVEVEGAWTPEQKAQIDRLDIAASIINMTDVSRAGLAAIYRGTAWCSSQRCGRVRLARNRSPGLRQRGGGKRPGNGTRSGRRRGCLLPEYADMPAWVDTVLRLMREPMSAPRGRPACNEPAPAIPGQRMPNHWGSIRRVRDRTLK